MMNMKKTILSLSLNIVIDGMFIQIIIGIFGVLFSTLGLALYIQADFGIIPFDASVILFVKKIKLNYVQIYYQFSNADP